MQFKRVLLIGLISMASWGQGANLLKNADFRQNTLTPPNYTLTTGSTQLTGWTVINGSLRYFSDNTGGKYIAMTTGGLMQTVSTLAGQQYRVTATMYGVHGNALVVKAGDARTEFAPGTTGDNVVRSWIFTATGPQTVFQIYPVSATEISLNAISITLVTEAETTKADLASTYAGMDASLYAHRVAEWLAHVSPGFTCQAGDKTETREQLNSRLSEEVKRTHYIVRTRVVDVSGGGPTAQAKIEETVTYEDEHRRQIKTTATDTWHKTGTQWMLEGRAVDGVKSFTDGREDTP